MDIVASAPPMYGDVPYPNSSFPGIFPTEAGMLITKVEMHVSCSNLRNRDLLSKSDPMVVLFTQEVAGAIKKWKEYDRTETVKDNLNPQFVKSFIIEYRFEELQKLKFEVYDCDSASPVLKEHDFLGKIEVTLGSVVGEYGGKVTKNLCSKSNEKMNSTIMFTAEEMNTSKEVVDIQFKARKLDKKDFFSMSDPFLIFFRQGIEGSESTPVHKTEVCKNSSNPQWKLFTVPVTTLCNGDKHRPIRIECNDWNSDGRYNVIGEMHTTLEELLSNETRSWELVNSKKKNKKKNYRNSGYLDLSFIKLRKNPSFLDYITGGIDLCFHVAIDFTASNGNPVQPTSLHFLDMNSPNKYLQALMSVGKICEDYDSDKLIPAYGFGAKINGKVFHNFPLNQSDDPACAGIFGVIDAYQRFLSTADLYGPTNFSPVINSVAQQAGAQQLIEKYHILLILTDGVIADIVQTKSAIINASKVPLSIIIVGIGDADFSAMDELDCDKGMLSHQGTTAEQDIVQFVPYRKFSGSFAADDLAREVLYEVPNQLVTFMTRYDIKPRVGQQKGLIHSVYDNSIKTQVVTTSSVPSAPLLSTKPVWNANDLPKHQENDKEQSRWQLRNENPTKRQAPFAPGQIPKTMSAKEAALLQLSKTTIAQ